MQIKFSKKFVKRFESSPLLIRRKFEDNLEIFISNKFDFLLNNHSLNGKYIGCRSINITGDWRAVFKDDGEVVIFIILGKHSQLYK
jgi:addiction module RelE/StbE family toxin